MAELENSADEITGRLLAEERHRPHTEDIVKLAGNIPSVTGVLVFSILITACASFNYGLGIGYSSPVEYKIREDLGLSTAEYSLFGTLLTIGGALGAIACGKTSDYLGRRGTFAVTDVFSIGGWLAIAVSQGALSLYLGRLLLGFALGLYAYVVPVYIAEISPKEHRGGFVMLDVLTGYTGIAIAYTLGTFISWRVLAAIGIIPNISQLIGLFFIPESPRWLMKVDKRNDFEAALQRLRGANADISGEAADIKVGIGLYTLAPLDGLNGILYYADSIFESAGLSSKLGSIALAIVQISSVLISLLIADKCGRRPLLMVSASGLCLACTLAGISFLLQDHGLLQGFSPYLALIGILMYSAFFSLGMAGMPALIISEKDVFYLNMALLFITQIYPINIKGLAGSMATLAGWVTSGLITYAFNFSMEWSSTGTFFIFAGVCGFTLLFVVKAVPETKGKTLEEIQASMKQVFGEQV